MTWVEGELPSSSLGAQVRISRKTPSYQIRSVQILGRVQRSLSDELRNEV